MVTVCIATQSGQPVELSRLFEDFRQTWKDATMKMDQGSMYIEIPSMRVVSQRLLLWQFNHSSICRYEMREL